MNEALLYSLPHERRRAYKTENVALFSYYAKSHKVTLNSFG